MKKHTVLHQQAVEQLLTYWSKYAKIKRSHFNWLLDHSTYHQVSTRGVLYQEGSREKNVYIVCGGLIARIYEDDASETDKIFSVALPGMALTTTEHLYSDRPSQGHIVGIRPSHILALPYETVHKYKKKDAKVAVLVDVLHSKKKKQLVQLRRLSLIQNPSERYLRFYRDMPMLRAILSQREMAMLLSISRSTIQRANRRIP
jgi:CRP-like cAMP-binding protein